ncbi:MAG TPA: acyl-CoA dehydrogenase family protein [Polyangiales bacterium]
MAKNLDFTGIVQQLGPDFAERAAAADLEGRFVADNYAALKREKLLSAAVPAELGGGGASYAEVCNGLRELAHYCGSTALALSMHTHLVAAAVWRYRHGQPAEPLLRRIAAEQLVLVSTGAGDWIDSVGKAERVPGGYRVNALKRFCSGAPAGDLLMTTAPSHDPERGDEVLHFALSLRAKGVSLQNDWDTLGMRGTGSVSVLLEDVFVPDEAVSLRRSAGQWHPAWSVTMTVAPAIYMAPYVGLAERAATLAKDAARKRAVEPVMLATLGQLENSLTLAQMAFREMVELAREYDFEPSTERASQLLVRKTLAANAVRTTLESAVELVGGSALFRSQGIERLMRDAAGAPFHPLPEKKQQQFTARVALGLPPVG